MPEPHISPNSFFHSTSSLSPSSSTAITTTTIYFISGNPGLISYYYPFLSLLSQKLSQSFKENHTFHIYGHSLAGFELATPTTKNANASHEDEHSRYYNLEDQICFVQQRLHEYIQSISTGTSSSSLPLAERERLPGKHRVILIGHSVGSYIAMEILRRHRERNFPPPPPAAAAATTSVVVGGGGGGEDGSGNVIDFDIVGGVMLFPTVVDIAKSPSGVKLTTLLRFIPQLALVVGLLVRMITAAFPDTVLRAIIGFYMGSPPEQAVNTTHSFLKSKRGVQQALHMAADEMEIITSDKWSDDVWGISAAKEPMTRLFFYFGRNDHWVAERTRDEILELRGRMQTGPKMVVCEESLPHAFCIRHSDVMSTKVADMIASIVTDL